MDLRGLSDKPWHVIEEADGRCRLEWNERAANDDSPLDLLDTSALALVEEVFERKGYDPYDSGGVRIQGSALYNRSRGKRTAFARQRRRT